MIARNLIYLGVAVVLAALVIVLFLWVEATWAKCIFGLLSVYGILNLLGGIA